MTLLLSASTFALVTAASAHNFDIPASDLKAALNAYSAQSGIPLIFSGDALKGIRANAVKGDLPSDDALDRLLKGTGFGTRHDPSGAVGIVRDTQALEHVEPMQLAQAAPQRSAVETVTVTSSKLGGADVQSIPIAITALSQEQLTSTQTAGGPDLVKNVPNLTFTKTNFTGYSIQIRGIGTQAISVATDPAVAVAFNDTPFIRNHFFEQEFFDVSQVEVLRGPQGTLYGRNATAGVVNLISARPTDQFEAMASAELGNYHQRRFEGMINLPIVDDRVALRFAGEWTKRQGYSFNEITNERIDGRDLWSGRATLGFKPSENFSAYFIWEHFSEDDDRIRSSKQLCKKQTPPDEIMGIPVPPPQAGIDASIRFGANALSQSCEPVSLYSPDAFQVPYGFSLPYVVAAGLSGLIDSNVDPYANTTQSRNLRVIESTIDPGYKAKNDTVELNADYNISPTLKFTSQTAFGNDFLWSTQDYNRFNTSPGVFIPDTSSAKLVDENGYFCDPQLGCANRFVAQDMSMARSWQASQEFRLTSNLSGPFNFSVGGNYLHYETSENYYVFINGLSLYTLGSAWTHDHPYVPGVSDNHGCLPRLQGAQAIGWQIPDPAAGGGQPTSSCAYMDPNPIGSLNNEGHNYFLSQNPYLLNSYAFFGETYYNITPDIKLTGGLRWTEDRKHFTSIPSQVITLGAGYPVTGAVNQVWDQFTGRFAANWTPKLDFTDQTLLYASYAHGYKAGGANPPGASFPVAYFAGSGEIGSPTHPLTFRPEFIDAFEAGTKNTLFDGALTLNASAFYYNYKDYQISEIVDRTAINNNFDARVKGAEIEAVWEPTPGLRFNFGGGWEATRVGNGQSAIDLMDRTAGHDGWMVVKPFPTQASNCILPTYVVSILLLQPGFGGQTANAPVLACEHAYNEGLDPVTMLPYKKDPDTVGSVTDGQTKPLDLPPGVTYAGFDPLSIDPNAPSDVNNGLGLPPNRGEGFAKDLSGNELPNAPPFTVSFGAQYSVPLSSDWAGTLRGDFYWQDDSWARIFNSNPYDRIRGYKNFNLALILTSQSGWQVMLYDKNVFNTTAITGAFLNSDDTGLTTNVFLTDPKLIGIRVTKNW
jgi:outer membrane receptor protein involved in Fe transport